jgi:hypothetical protein
MCCEWELTRRLRDVQIELDFLGGIFMKPKAMEIGNILRFDSN